MMKGIQPQRQVTRPILLPKVRILLWTLFLSISLTLFSFFPVGELNQTIPIASAHALPVKTDPGSDAILKTPPSQVTIWFSEALIPETSHLIVVNTTNHEVDNNDSTVSQSDVMSVTLPLLPSGTYIVVWRSQSAFDGHVAGGSYIFRIARPDGSVPPIPTTLPTGHIPGAAGNGIPTTGLDAYTTLQSIMTWFSLMLMTFWVGGIFWESWVLPPDQQKESGLARATQVASRRFRWLIPVILSLLFLTNLGIVCGECAELAGSWSGAYALPLLNVVLFESRFGTFWWMRQIVVFLALLLILFLRWKLRLEQVHPEKSDTIEASPEVEIVATELEATTPIPRWWKEVIASLSGIKLLPRRLIDGWYDQPWTGRVELLLGFALILAFALSGHAAAVSANELAYALSVDILHLLGDVTWVGGLFYIAVILVPALFRQGTTHQSARTLATGLPAFSAFAIVTWILLATTGSLTTTIHLTSFEQFWTTLYGRILTIKITLFCIMAVISAYHAFFLRSRLSRALNSAQSQSVSAEFKEGAREESFTDEKTSSLSTSASTKDPSYLRMVRQQAHNLAHWLQIEAFLGASVLLCVALLSAFAGTLSTTPTSDGTTSSTQTHGSFVQTQQKQGYSVTLKVAPDTFGTNTFSVLVEDLHGHALPGSGVAIETTMLDMDMGTQEIQLEAVSKSPGTYAASTDLTMEGHWQVAILLLPPKVNHFIRYTFTFSTQ